jgi:hypothetical protein
MTEFADPPPSVATQRVPQVPSTEVRAVEPLVPTSQAPTTLMQWAVLILNTPNPTLKARRCHYFWRDLYGF